MKRDNRYLNFCYKESLKSSVLNSLHGCVAVKGGKILASGYNQYHNRYFRTLHAEVHVLLQLAKKGIDPRQVQMYVSRFQKNSGAPLYSKPCAQCQIQLSEQLVRRLYYTDRNGNWSKYDPLAEQ